MHRPLVLLNTSLIVLLILLLFLLLLAGILLHEVNALKEDIEQIEGGCDAANLVIDRLGDLFASLHLTCAIH